MLLIFCPLYVRLNLYKFSLPTNQNPILLIHRDISHFTVCKKITSPTQTTELAAMRLQTVLIAVIVAAAFCGGDVAAQSSDCNNVLISMSSCLDYITGNSSRPSSSCCSQLSNAVKSQPQCLCEVIKGGGSSASSLGINVNQTQAMALPSACNVQTPPVSRCNGVYQNIFLSH